MDVAMDTAQNLATHELQDAGTHETHNSGTHEVRSAPAPEPVKPEWWHAACTALQVDPVVLDWTLCACLALPHFLYAFIWLLPKTWHHLFGKKAVQVFAACGFWGKVIQFTAAVTWLWASRGGGLCFHLAAIPLWQWLAFLVLGCFGQSLNVGIFKAIGKDGVYYGTKLGHRVPWVDGFPFNIISHPQYVGSVLSIWAVGLLLHNQLPEQAWIVGVFWTALYVVTALQEQFL